MQGDWLVALATIVAAIIGVVGGYVLARYQREKKILRFIVSDAEDLAAALRVHGNFEIKFADFSTTELILSAISVRNVGNSSIKDIEFGVKIPGRHPFAQVTCTGKSPAMPSQVKVAVSLPVADSPDHILQMSLPFLNANKSFRINALYTGQPVQCEVTCRLPDTTVEVYTLSELYRMDARRDRWRFALSTILSVIIATVLTFGVALVKKLF